MADQVASTYAQLQIARGVWLEVIRHASREIDAIDGQIARIIKQLGREPEGVVVDAHFTGGEPKDEAGSD